MSDNAIGMIVLGAVVITMLIGLFALMFFDR